MKEKYIGETIKDNIDYWKNLYFIEKEKNKKLKKLKKNAYIAVARQELELERKKVSYLTKMSDIMDVRAESYNQKYFHK